MGPVSSKGVTVLGLVLLATVAADPPPFSPSPGPVSAGLSAVIAGGDPMQVSIPILYKTSHATA